MTTMKHPWNLLWEAPELLTLFQLLCFLENVSVPWMQKWAKMWLLRPGWFEQPCSHVRGKGDKRISDKLQWMSDDCWWLLMIADDCWWLLCATEVLLASKHIRPFNPSLQDIWIKIEDPVARMQTGSSVKTGWLSKTQSPGTNEAGIGHSPSTWMSLKNGASLSLATEHRWRPCAVSMCLPISAVEYFLPYVAISCSHNCFHGRSWRWTLGWSKTQSPNWDARNAIQIESAVEHRGPSGPYLSMELTFLDRIKIDGL